MPSSVRDLVQALDVGMVSCTKVKPSCLGPKNSLTLDSSGVTAPGRPGYQDSSSLDRDYYYSSLTWVAPQGLAVLHDCFCRACGLSCRVLHSCPALLSFSPGSFASTFSFAPVLVISPKLSGFRVFSSLAQPGPLTAPPNLTLLPRLSLPSRFWPKQMSNGQMK